MKIALKMIFTEKNVVVVGACGGIGLATCRELLKKNIRNLVMVDFVESCDILANLQKEYTGTVISLVKMDISNKNEIKSVYNQISERIKFINILVNCAGVLCDDNPELTINVNLLGVINSTLTMFNLMDKSQGGRGGLILNVASVLGLEPFPSLAIYSASKHGVVAFTRSLGVDFYFDKTAVSLIAVCPGFTNTPMIRNNASHFTFPYASEHSKTVKAKLQTADECAQSIVEAIQLNKNGSVWICECGKLKEMNMKKYWEV